MNVSWSGLPAPARAVAVAVTGAVEAARAQDPEAFQRAAGELAALNPEQTGLVLGAVVRALLEEGHPDGITGDDVRAILERCAVSTSAWFPGVDINVMIVLLSGALGVHPGREEAPAPTPEETATHGPLLTSHLLATRPLTPYLAFAFTEIAQHQTADTP